MEYNLKLRELREAKGLNQRRVAAELGITPSAVAQWELGQKNPTMRNLIALADLLGCTTDQLLGRDRQTSA